MKHFKSYKTVCKKEIIRISLFGYLLLSLISIQAQQPQVYNQFFMNPYVYNPAYAGVEGHTAIFVMYRDQWANIKDAPKISHASFHIPLQGGFAIGGAAFNVTQGLLTTSSAKISGAYLVNIDHTHFLRFGMSLGAGINSVNITKFDSPGDMAFDDFLDKSTFFMGDVGIAYHFGHFNLGISLPNLINYNPITQNKIADIKFSPADNVLFKMNYRGHINDNFAFEPHIIYRFSNVLPHQIEGTLIAHLYHLVWIGASYRHDAGIIGLAGAKIAEKFAIGLAYELGNPDISSELGPTLEINLGYHLGTKKDHAQHVSSFIKSRRLSAEERALEAEQERQKLLADSEQDENIAPDDENALTIAQPTNTDIPSGNEILPTKRADEWVRQEGYDEITRVNEYGEEDTGIRLEKPNSDEDKNLVISWVPNSQVGNLTVAPDGHLERTLPDESTEVGIRYEKTNADGSAENSVMKWDRAINKSQAEVISNNSYLTKERYDQIAKSNPVLTNDFRTHEELGLSDDYVVTKRGNHLLELPIGSYVIAGAFSIFRHAENYSDELFLIGFHDTIVGYNSGRGYYYVVIYKSDNISQTRSKRDEFRKMPKLLKAWVLQVTE